MSTYTIDKTWSLSQGKRFLLRSPDGQFRGHFHSAADAWERGVQLSNRRWP